MMGYADQPMLQNMTENVLHIASSTLLDLRKRVTLLPLILDTYFCVEANLLVSRSFPAAWL